MDVLLPNPRNLSTYIECVNACPKIRPCSAGLRFEQESNNCVLEEYVPDTEINICDNADIKEVTFEPDPKEDAVYYVCISGIVVKKVCEKGFVFNSSVNACSPSVNGQQHISPESIESESIES